jgi:hypothetical protein
MVTNILWLHIYIYMSIYYTGMELVTYSQDLTAYDLICILYLLKQDFKYSGTAIEWVWPCNKDFFYSKKIISTINFCMENPHKAIPF